MASANAVWGIDVGQCALKALRMQLAPDGNIEVTNFDIVEHPKILSQPDADHDQLVRNALDKFLSRNDIGNAEVCLSVPGQSSFARFIKLPPVETKRIPQIIEFEAVQQIPFDIEEVVWDYQVFSSDASPDVEVGIFAMRKELVLNFLANFQAAGIEPDVVQLAPLSLYNMMVYDSQTTKKGATILIDVGAENTDLVISDGERIWMRSIPLGGNNFTESLVKAFKLPFSKAENLKRTAATSKYARQIFVAMRPVFGDLVSEVQRSIGFYTTLHRDAEIGKVICLGNAFRLPGLQKYLEQNLSVETVRLNAFNRLKPSDAINAPAFQENMLSFGVAYGLGLQGLGISPIQSNLLPVSIQKVRNLRAQRPWFAAAALVMVAATGLAWWSTGKMAANAAQDLKLPDGPFKRAEQVLAKHQAIQNQVQKLKGQGQAEKEEIANIKKVSGYRDVALQVAHLVQSAWPGGYHGIWVQEVAKSLGKPEADVTMSDIREWTRQEGNRGKIPFALLEDMRMTFYPTRPAQPTAAAAGGANQPTQPPPLSAGQGGEPGKWYQVNIRGTINWPRDDAATKLQNDFIQRLQVLKRADKEKELDPRKGPPIYADIELDEASLRDALIRIDYVAPQLSGGGPGGIAGAPGVGPGETGPTDPLGNRQGTDVAFTMSFNVKVNVQTSGPGGPTPAQPTAGNRNPR